MYYSIRRLRKKIRRGFALIKQNIVYAYFWHKFAMYFICLLFVDELQTVTRAGKVRGNILPPEHTLSYFIENVENPHPSWNTTTPACSWDGICCNELAQVIEIKWQGRRLRGFLNWGKLPSTMVSINVGTGAYGLRNHLTGMIEFILLLPGLEKLLAMKANFSGDLDFTQLPDSMRNVVLNGNRFSGGLNFLQLPSGLNTLVLSSNFFSGVVDFTNLPSKLHHLEIDAYVIIPLGKVPPCVIFV